MSKVIYNYDPDGGQITRDDEVVATLDETTKVVSFAEGHNTLVLPISKFLKTMGHTGCTYDKFIVDDGVEIISEASTLDPFPPEDSAPPLPPATGPKEMAIPTVEGAPPFPKMNPRLGDKTREVVAWYKKYDLPEYTRRYGITKFDVEFPVFDPVTGEQTGSVTKDLGTRRCDTIEKTVGRSEEGAYDWETVGPTVKEGA
tara:strand:+ start:7711 stop:8310 length:600 start_codon:yes stop_codon:yes gene_type:complete